MNLVGDGENIIKCKEMIDNSVKYFQVCYPVYYPSLCLIHSQLYTSISLRLDMSDWRGTEGKADPTYVLPSEFIPHLTDIIQNYSFTITACCSRNLLRSGGGCWKDCTVLWPGCSLSHRFGGLWGNRKDVGRSSHLSPSRYRPPVWSSSIFCSMRRHHHLRRPCYCDFAGHRSTGRQWRKSKYNSISCAHDSAPFFVSSR